MTFVTTRRVVLTAVAALGFAGVLSGPAHADAVTLSFLIDNAPSTVAVAEELKKQFEAANPDIKIELEQRPGGADGTTSSRRASRPAT